MKNLFQMMSTPKQNNLWEGIQGYQDGGLFSNLLNYDPVQASKDYYAGQYASEASPLDIKRGAMEGFSPQMVSAPEVSQASGLMDIGRNLPAAIEAPELSLQRPAMEAFSPEGVAYPDMPTPNIMPSPDEEDIINLNYLGRPEEELQGLATEAFGRERNPLTQMLMRSESAAQAGDKRRAAEAVQRSKEQIIDEEIANIYGQGRKQDRKQDRKQRFGDFKTRLSDYLKGDINQIDPDVSTNLEALAEAEFGKKLNPAEMLAGRTSDWYKRSVQPELKKGVDYAGKALGKLGGAGIGAAGAGIGALGAGLGYGIKGTGTLLGALAGIPGDISKAYQSYGEGEKYPALAQLMSASQGRIMPNIYSSLYRQDGGIIPYAVGGQVQQDPNKAWTFGTTNPVTPSQPSYAVTLPPNPPNPPNLPGDDDPHLGAGDVGMGTGVYNPTSPAGDPNDPVSYGYGGDQYGAGQLGTTGQYMGDYGGYASMFGGDTGSAASLSQAEENLGIELTDEQRKLYGEYNPRIEEMGINIGGRRGLLGLTKDRQTQMSQSGFAGMDSTAYGVGREDLLRDIDLQKRGKRAGYQKDIAGQVAEDIRAGVNIKETGDNPPPPTWDVPPTDDPAWSPPEGVGSGTPYDFGGVTWIFDPPNWVTEDQYESDMSDHYDTQP